MTTYMTPDKYRTMGFGIDLSDLDTENDVELASILARASVIADAYCTVPKRPRPYSFLGGSITLESPEQHLWRLPENDFDLGQRRVYPYAWPIKQVTDFRVRVTNTQYVQVQPSELFINNTERYVEVISLAFTGVGLFGMIMPTLGLMKPIAEICYDYGFHFEQVGERLFATDARTYRAEHQFWINDDPAETNVYVNGTKQTSGFTVLWDEGAILFDEAPETGSVVTADYESRLPSEVRDAIAHITTYLLGERDKQKRGMTGVASLSVAEVKIVNQQPRMARGGLTAQNLAERVPEAAWLLDGYSFVTVR